VSREKWSSGLEPERNFFRQTKDTKATAG